MVHYILAQRQTICAIGSFKLYNRLHDTMALAVDAQTMQDLLLGIASNGLWTLIANAGAKTFGVLKEEVEKDLIGDVYSVVAASVCKHFPGTDGSENFKLRRFLVSPEVESVVRQLYSIQVLNSTEKSHLPAIRDEFLTLFALHLDVSPDAVSAAANTIFDALVRECERQLNVAIKANLVTSALEAQSNVRHKQLLGEVANIKRTLNLLKSDKQPTIVAIMEFEEKYRNQVGTRHAFIQPPHLETARKFPIDELYVTPTLLSGPIRKRNKKDRTTAAEFLAGAHRAVLLGNPGGGKSTFALKLCYDLASRYSDRLLAGRLLTPILVTLREYGGQKKSEHCSILQFIESQANSRYQVTAPNGAFEYLLLSGRVMVVFDGLDELLDTSYRQEISSDVESFCNLYASVPALVTSREVGYEQASLDPKQFRLFRVAPFDEHQVLEYATKWFGCDDELTSEQQKSKAKAFLNESSLASDLRSNPLMLGLMCNLYRVDGYIPRNRPEIYEKCSLMLFERWDKSRGIVVSLPFEEHIKPAMQHLAYWIYSQEELQGGVTHTKLVDETSAYLNKWVFEETLKAQRAASDFIDFCTGRAWVFTDTGTTAEGEKLYQFTHRTFLEYFAAIYLFSVYPTPDQLGRILRPHIAKQEWDVVALLAFQLQSRRVQGAGDKLLLDLLEAAHALGHDSQWNMLLFAARCLESIVPSPAARRAVAAACLRACVRVDRRDTGEGRVSMSMLFALRSASPENRATVGETVAQTLTEGIQSSHISTSVAAYDFAFGLVQPFYNPFRSQELSSENYDYWSELGNRVLVSASPRLEAIAKSDFYVASTAFHRGEIPIAKFLEWHGSKGVFGMPRSPVFMMWRAPLSVWLLVLRCRESEEDGVRREGDLAALGRFLISVDPPWTEIRNEQYPNGMFLEDLFLSEGNQIRVDAVQAPTAEACFAVFAAVAVVLEAATESQRKMFAHALDRIPLPHLSIVGPALQARFDPAYLVEAKNSGLPEPYQSKMMEWANGKISFTRKRTRRQSSREQPLVEEVASQIDLMLDDESCSIASEGSE